MFSLPSLLSTQVLVGFLALMVGGLTLPGRADTLDSVYKTRVLRAAVPQDFPPFGSVDKDLNPIGYDIEVAALIARGLGVRLELVPVASSNRVLYLKTRKVDVVISNLGKSPERAQVIDFSVAYAPYYNGVFGPKELSVSKFAELAGVRIGVTRGAFEDLQISEAAPASVIIKRYDDNNSTIAAFLSGQVDLIGSGNTVAAAILAQNPPKRPELKFLIKESPCSIGVDKGEARLLARVNEIINEAKKNGALSQISQKWLLAPLPADL